LGKAEILKDGGDITVVSYGSTLRIVLEAAVELEKMGIHIEIIDPQTLYPFDIDNVCGTSLKRPANYWLSTKMYRERHQPILFKR